MKLSDFDYHLTKGRIAAYPAGERDLSKLLVLSRRDGRISHRIFRDVVEYLRAGDVLVLNDTRVIPARLHGKKASGGKVEVLLIEELHTNKWQVVVKGLKQGYVEFRRGICGYVSRSNGTAAVTFRGVDIKPILKEIGVMPLPPYIKRPAGELDNQRYQTVYAEKDGAVAAPTAGLHFTEEVLDIIKDRGVEVCKLTLHVGYGTFKPVACQKIEEHKMDEERYEITENTADTINRAMSEGRRVIAVGTTVTRALETSALSGSAGRVNAGTGKAGIFIYPGYKFRVIDVLVTNFHLPRSTPLMLTSAFCGLPLLKRAYIEALGGNYRFFFYGDAMLIV